MNIHFSTTAKGSSLTTAQAYKAPKQGNGWLIITLEALAMFAIVALVVANVVL